jgi:hypothetical protein
MAPNWAAPGEVPDALHLLFPVEPPEVVLSGLRLPVAEQPLVK